jgi:hypothetical protein
VDAIPPGCYAVKSSVEERGGLAQRLVRIDAQHAFEGHCADSVVAQDRAGKGANILPPPPGIFVLEMSRLIRAPTDREDFCRCK